MSNLSKKYIQTSNWDGQYYANHSSWQFYVASKAMKYIQIPNDAKILDIGCGDGRFTKYLASLIPDGEILGLDPSSSMLAVARTNKLPNLSFTEGDAVNLPFENQFDFVVAFNSLHWVSETNIALEQVRKALKPGGRALILVAPVQVRHPLHSVIDRVAKSDRWSSYFGNVTSIFSFHSVASWAAFIEAAQLIPENLQLMDASLDYPDKKAFADSLVGWIPFGTIPNDKRSEYIQEVVEAYATVIPCGPSGVVHYRLDELVMIISKTFD